MNFPTNINYHKNSTSKQKSMKLNLSPVPHKFNEENYNCHHSFFDLKSQINYFKDNSNLIMASNNIDSSFKLNTIDTENNLHKNSFFNYNEKITNNGQLTTINDLNKPKLNFIHTSQKLTNNNFNKINEFSLNSNSKNKYNNDINYVSNNELPIPNKINNKKINDNSLNSKSNKKYNIEIKNIPNNESPCSNLFNFNKINDYSLNSNSKNKYNNDINYVSNNVLPLPNKFNNKKINDNSLNFNAKNKNEIKNIPNYDSPILNKYNNKKINDNSLNSKAYYVNSFNSKSNNEFNNEIKNIPNYQSPILNKNNMNKINDNSLNSKANNEFNNEIKNIPNYQSPIPNKNKLNKINDNSPIDKSASLKKKDFKKIDADLKPHNPFFKKMNSLHNSKSDLLIKECQILKFFWKSNLNPFNSNEQEEWEAYDQNNQDYLNQKYQVYCQFENENIVFLLPPLDNYYIDFKEKSQIHRYDNYKCRPIKCEEILNNSPFLVNPQINFEENHLINKFQAQFLLSTDKSNKKSISNIDLKQDLESLDKSDIKKNIHNKNMICKKESINSKEEFIFFWKSNPNPWDLNEQPIWTPFDLEDECILRKAYEIYLDDKTKSKVDLKDPADHFVDFSKMLQINKNDENRQRQVQRCNPKKVTNIVRINRFDTPLLLGENKVKLDIIEKLTLDNSECKSFFNNNKKEINDKIKKINKIIFKVFPVFPCEVEIEEELSFFPDKSVINISMKELKKILIEEISNLGKECENENNNNKLSSLEIYSQKIEEISNFQNFFENIVFIYTLEGYLYKKLNENLRTYNKIAFKKIKYFYTCLLASFQYLSKN